MTETRNNEIKPASEIDAPGGDGHTTASALPALKPDAKEPAVAEDAGEAGPRGGGTVTESGSGTSGGAGGTGDRGGPAEIDTLRDMQGDVPLPHGLDEHAPIPGRDNDAVPPGRSE